jgi:hypothetical protein
MPFFAWTKEFISIITIANQEREQNEKLDENNNELRGLQNEQKKYRDVVSDMKHIYRYDKNEQEIAAIKVLLEKLEDSEGRTQFITSL